MQSKDSVAPSIRIISPYLDGDADLSRYALQVTVSGEVALPIVTALGILSMSFAEEIVTSDPERPLELGQLQALVSLLGAERCAEFYPGVQVITEPYKLGYRVTIVGSWPLPATPEQFEDDGELFVALSEILTNVFNVEVKLPFIAFEAPPVAKGTIPAQSATPFLFYFGPGLSS